MHRQPQSGDSLFDLQTPDLEKMYDSKSPGMPLSMDFDTILDNLGGENGEQQFNPLDNGNFPAQNNEMNFNFDFETFLQRSQGDIVSSEDYLKELERELEFGNMIMD